MAFKLLLAPRRYDQISHLRRQEAPQPAHALDFAHLVGDALFELLIELDRSSSVFRSSFSSRAFSIAITACAASSDQFNLLIGERTNFLAVNVNAPTNSSSLSSGTIITSGCRQVHGRQPMGRFVE